MTCRLNFDRDFRFYVNKLTYSEYREYFAKLGFHILEEHFTKAPFDWEFYRRHEDRLGLYPIWDLETNFFETWLLKEKRYAPAHGLGLGKVLLDPKRAAYMPGDSVTATAVLSRGEDAEYAFYLYRNGNIRERTPYEPASSHAFLLAEEGTFEVKAFARDRWGNKVSARSARVVVGESGEI